MPTLRTYVVVVALAVAAVVARALLEPLIEDRVRFLVPLVVVGVAGAIGGRGPAIAAAVAGGLGTLIVAALVTPGALTLELIPAALYALGVVAVVAITERLRGAREAAQLQASRLDATLAERDRVLEREQQERRLAERRARILDGMQELSIVVAGTALPPAEMAGRVLEVAIGVLGASTGAIAVREDDVPELRMLAMRGYPPQVVEDYARIPVDADLPFARAARSGVAEWLKTESERREAMPPDVAAALDDVGGAAIVPLDVGGRVFGAIAFGMPAGAGISADDRSFIGLVARKAAQAIERSRLVEAGRLADRAERERAEQLRAVLETMQDGIAIVAEGKIGFRNAALDRLAGREVRSLDDLAGALGVAPAELRASAPHEVVASGPGGVQRWLEVAGWPIGPEPAEHGSLVVVRDVTAARTAVAVRDAFVGMLSHELRTPITVILGSAGLLRRRFPAGDPSLEMVEDITAESERMNQLIDDLLVVSVPEIGPTAHPDPVLVRHVLAGAVALEARRHPGARLEVDAPAGLPPVAGDQTLLEQVVRNLIGNAVKYAGPRASVVLAAREVDNGIEVSISDDGPGIPEGERHAVFDIFFRSRSTAARAGGAGIGLFVCRRLIESMGGRIWASEAPGGGACLRFTIPTYASGPLDDGGDDDGELGAVAGRTEAAPASSPGPAAEEALPTGG